uniref:Uncharacterized protein n=1 Tax=Desulfobacca acetoxidans TaxID=60893 RepID=A0A7V4G6T1_9BACT
MRCQTIKPDMECTFMTKKGCSFNGGKCHTIVDNCEGCERILETGEGRFCASFPDPAVKWRRGVCNLATHQKANLKAAAQANQKINPLKASKRAASGR